MKTEELKQLIRESVTTQLARLKERATSNKQYQAKTACKIMQEQVNALKKLRDVTEKLFTETQYSELTTHRTSLEELIAAKEAKIAEIKDKFQLLDKKKKMVPKKKFAPKKKVVDTKTGMKKLAPVKK